MLVLSESHHDAIPTEKQGNMQGESLQLEATCRSFALRGICTGFARALNLSRHRLHANPGLSLVSISLSRILFRTRFGVFLQPSRLARPQ
jgi:hypothetical protein